MNSTGKPVVRILGSEDLSSLYPLFDLLLLPSKREGLPNVVLEAAASGVPSIVTNATGAVDSVVSGETGIVVPLGDEDAFVRAAIELLSNRTRAATMGEAARWWVRDHFDAEKVSQQHFEFYSSLVSAEKW
jgi:glycosyltransferase involved in cell wall biosynthesis